MVGLSPSRGGAGVAVARSRPLLRGDRTATDLASAERDEQRIVAAVVAYHARNGEYPPSLDALVPNHLAVVPRARIVRGYLGRFRYFARPEGPVLEWSVAASHIKHFYYFKDRRHNVYSMS